MNQILKVCFVFILITGSAMAESIQSQFGFEVEVGKDWVVWNKKVSEQNVSSQILAKSQFGLISKEDTVSYLKMVKQVANGDLEYFYDKKSLLSPMKNNMNIKLSDKKFEMDRGQAITYCKSLPDELPKLYNQSITVSYCGFFEVENYRYFGVIYTMNHAKIAIFEYNMPTKDDKTLILVGGTDQEGSDRMQKGLNVMINAIAKIQ
ncbi:hypothetical protein OAA91_00160 [Fibrobacterales bacterium]|nr:hypothetical protein [Fibrobacterales bacterium]